MSWLYDIEEKVRLRMWASRNTGGANNDAVATRNLCFKALQALEAERLIEPQGFSLGEAILSDGKKFRFEIMVTIRNTREKRVADVIILKDYSLTDVLKILKNKLKFDRRTQLTWL